MPSQAYQAYCTSCGKKGNTTVQDPSKMSAYNVQMSVSGKCPNTNDGKHVVSWTKK